ncbi:hypothetical protein [Streptomyces sp. RTd22]|uniref:hypothetical protein n=1 Tax=Streptomyces sp. RTd22 TaxID=1841249 RepID=UPI000A5D8C47|nr:hypothetical protein [Streptomyces sp. RTd22]
MNVVINIDGVLKRPDSDAVVPAGQLLYHGLAETHVVHLVDDSDTFNSSKLLAENWLRRSGFTKHIRLIKPYASDRHALIGGLKSLRPDLHVDLVVVADPTVAGDLLAAGYSTVLFCHPRYSRPQWKPDYRGQPRAWDDLVTEIEEQDRHYAQDARRTTGPL